MGVEHRLIAFRSLGGLGKYLLTPGASVDLLLLDILMKEQNGFEFADRLRLRGCQIPLIFITSTMDFALEGYRVNALGYLLKPVQRAELKEALARARRRSQDAAVTLNSPSKTVSFRLREVLYLDIRDKELAVHTADGNVLNISVPPNSLLPKLPPEQFVRCYRSYIVSLSAVSSIWRYGIELKNGETIPLSRSYYAAVQNALMDWTAQQ